MNNPFAPFIARMDELVPLLESGKLEETEEMVDLIRRAMFALVNHINAQAQYMQALILPVEGEVVPNDTDASSVDQPS